MIEVRGLRVRLGADAVVRVDELAVPPGSALALIGPNGSGKSTLLRVLCTLQAPSRGLARVAGHDVARDPEAVRRLVGYLPELPDAVEDLPAWEWLDLFAAARAVAGGRRGRLVHDALELVGLHGLRHVSVAAMSRGLRQRLCLARALLHDPAVLLLDEPTAGLDLAGRLELAEVVRELAGMGKSLVIASNALDEVADACDSVAVLGDGRVLLHPAVEGRSVAITVLGDPAAAAAAVAERPGTRDVRALSGSIELVFDGSDPELAALVDHLRSAGHTVLWVTPAEHLADRFLRTGDGP